jgi:protein gp37
VSATTKIEWADRSWNPVRGCSLVSTGCRACYAMKQAHRFSGAGQPYEGLTELGPAGPRWTGKVRLVEEALTEPLRWKRPQRIFVNSMSDLFHDDVPFDFIDRVFAVMALAPRHTFQILTKRPDRMRFYLVDGRADRVAQAAKVLHTTVRPFALPSTEVFDGRRVALGQPWLLHAWPLPNVWLGVSCENQQTADERIPLLLQTPAAVRFVSAEPLLGPIDFTKIAVPDEHAGKYAGHGFTFNALHRDDDLTMFNSPAHLDLVIPGGESGARPRRCNVRWIRSIVRQCQAFDVAAFVKQLGAVVIDRNDAGFLGEEPHHWPDIIDQEDRVEYDLDGTRDGYQGAPVRIHLRDRKGGEMSEWPEDLRVRKFPVMREAVSAWTP